MKAAQRLTGQEKVAAVFSGYCSNDSSEFRTYADAGVPMFHFNTLQDNVDYVANNSIDNIYEGCPTEIWYGRGFVPLMQSWIDGGQWTPSSKSAAVVTSNDPYSISIANTLSADIKKAGWTVPIFEQVTAPTADWGPVLSKIRANPPGLVFVTDYIAGDLASFAKQFATAPTPSLLYQQYGPSIPEYIQLAGDAANGVIWSTTIGTLPDKLGQDFLALYKQKFNAEAGLSQAGGQYDIIRMWSGVAALAGDPYDYAKVNTMMKKAIFRGVNGTYTFEAKELVGAAVPGQGRRHQPGDGPPDLPDPGPQAGPDLARAVRERHLQAPALAEVTVERGALLEADGVVKTYGGLSAVDGLSFRVDEGETFGIAGPNGAGKTTLFDVVTGMVRASAGQIRLQGRPIQDATVHEICRLGVARTFQQPSVFDTQTVLSNALAGAQFGSRRSWWTGLRLGAPTLQAAMAELEFVGLAEQAGELAGPLPVFDKKRLMIASALATKPTLLFLDEPFGGLNAGEVDSLMELLRAIKDRGITLVLIEHVMRALMSLSDRVLIMNHGRSLFEGSPADVIADEEVVRVYLGRAGVTDHG